MTDLYAFNDVSITYKKKNKKVMTDLIVVQVQKDNFDLEQSM